jgi:hypothetical protein
MASVHVSVNGVPVEKVIDEMMHEEYRLHHDSEIKQMRVIASLSKSHNSARMTNHSGSRSGRGRVIYRAGGAA